MSNQTVSPKPNQATKRPRFKAAFTKEQAEEIEKKHNTTKGVQRRVLMSTMSLSSKEMIDRFSPLVNERDGETLFAMLDMIGDYQQYLKASIELSDAAIARILWVGKYISEKEDVKQH